MLSLTSTQGTWARATVGSQPSLFINSTRGLGVEWPGWRTQALDVTCGIAGLSGNGRARCGHRSLFPCVSGLLLTEPSLRSTSALNPPQPRLPPPDTHLCHLLPGCLLALPRQQPGQVLLAPRPPPHLMGSPSPRPRLRAPVCAPQGGPGTGTRSPGGCQPGSACV